MSIVLETQNVSKVFGGLRAVDGVSIRVEAGTLHSVIGPNGAGKTTLFNLINGNLKPTTGRVLYKGRDITALPLHRIAHMGIGRSFQIINIFPNLSALENVRLAVQARGHANFKFWSRADSVGDYEERARRALTQVGLSAKAQTTASVLPHGDKRKLELAILLAPEPELLLLDEPTAGMASEQVPELMDVIRDVRARGNKTVILVEHNMNVVMNVSDRISVMHQGRVLAEGTPGEIAANQAVQAAYLGKLYETKT